MPEKERKKCFNYFIAVFSSIHRTKEAMRTIKLKILVIKLLSSTKTRNFTSLLFFALMLLTWELRNFQFIYYFSENCILIPWIVHHFIYFISWKKERNLYQEKMMMNDVMNACMGSNLLSMHEKCFKKRMEIEFFPV